MVELPNDFWSGWIIILTLVSFGALIWMIISIYFRGTDEATTEEPVWDNDLREGLTAPPMWWFWLIFSLIIFSVIYLIMYPGLGSYRGVLNWSQDSRIEGSYENYQQQFREIRDEIAATDLSVLQQSPEYMQVAERIFTRECSVCHGYDGRGQANLFPNLMDIDWQWGGTSEQIEQSIRNGRQAIMTPWNSMLNPEEVNQVADFVLALGSDAADSHTGKEKYMQVCFACHGPDGTGNVLLGAPNLTDSTWLYGSEKDAIIEAINNGRNGVMPAFNEMLDDTQIKLLVAWLAR